MIIRDYSAKFLKANFQKSKQKRSLDLFLDPCWTQSCPIIHNWFETRCLRSIARCRLALCMQPFQMQVNSQLMIGAPRWLPEISDGRLDAHSQVPFSIVMHCPCNAFRCAAHLIIGAPRWLPVIQLGRLLHLGCAHSVF